jgi:DnaJ-class molecular chaperone
MAKCLVCNGTGNFNEICPDCKGTGNCACLQCLEAELLSPKCQNKGCYIRSYYICPKCSKENFIIEHIGHDNLQEQFSKCDCFN